MARSLTISTYVALLGAGEVGEDQEFVSPRPDGAVIWARCSELEQVNAVLSLEQKLRNEGDVVHIVPTFSKSDSSAYPHPMGRLQSREFLRHWRPDLVLCVGDELDPYLLVECAAVAAPCVMIDANGDGRFPAKARWLPGMNGALLRQFDSILAVDREAAVKLIHAGATPEQVRIVGKLQASQAPPTYNEPERRDLARTIGSRPIWFAAAVNLNEVDVIGAAHRQASRRSHRLLLILEATTSSNGRQIALKLTEAGFTVVQRSDDAEPDDSTQIYIVDAAEELGLWYRLAPITYFGGSLRGGGCRDPFEAASLGSAVVHGPHTAPHAIHFQRLRSGKACYAIDSAGDLGIAIETLLAPDQTANLAHAGWEVTSSGANVTNQIVALIREKFDRVGL